jgi:hypothetical protein
MRSRCFVLAGLVAIALALPAAASARTEGARGGDVEATLTYPIRPGTDNLFVDRRVELRIVRGAAVVLDRVLRRPCRGCPRIPIGALGAHGPSLGVRDLDGDGRPEVRVAFYTGGAHCCQLLAVFFPARGGYRSRVENFRDPGYRLRDVGGDARPEFVSADARFAYAFSSFAASGFPPRILAFRRGRFVDVTRAFPGRIRRDARRQLARSRRYRAEPLGFLAAYVADEYLLGHPERGWAEVRRRRVPATFPARLRRVLRRFGYTR